LNTALLLTLLIIAPCFAWADNNWDFDRPYTLKCSEGGQAQMNICLEKEYERIDNRLNALYKQLLNSLENPKKLKEAQKAWIRFRNLDCDYASSGILKEGSYYYYSQTACYIDQTEKRIRDLQKYLKWEGNGSPPRK